MVISVALDVICNSHVEEIHNKILGYFHRSLGQASHPTVSLATTSDGYLVHECKVGSTCAGCAFVAAGKESEEHACKHGYQTINWYLM